MSDDLSNWPPPSTSTPGYGGPPQPQPPYGLMPPPPYGAPASGQMPAYLNTPPPGYPNMPPPGYGQAYPQVEPDRPQLLHAIAGLLVLNLMLSLGVTIASLLLRNSLIDFQLDHRHITDPELRATLRDSYGYTIVVRALGNVVVSIVYFFLVRALFRGRRWAYRRVIWLGSAGALLLLFTLATPYPLWLHVEQVVQAMNLAVMVYLVTRPPVRAFFASGLPGRDTRRFRKS